MVPKLIIAGVAFIGGAFVLLFASQEAEAANEQSGNDTNKKKDSSNFDVDRVRAARRELRYQARQKKKLAAAIKPPPGEDE